MGIELETQTHEEVMQIKSRELQMDNTEKLNNIIPVVESIDEVNLPQIESDASDIKEIVIQNLEEQTNLDDIKDSIDKINKSISTVKGQVTKLSKKIDELLEALNEG